MPPHPPVGGSVFTGVSDSHVGNKKTIPISKQNFHKHANKFIGLFKVVSVCLGEDGNGTSGNHVWPGKDLI